MFHLYEEAKMKIFLMTFAGIEDKLSVVGV
jgi:hypothetical protein